MLTSSPALAIMRNALVQKKYQKINPLELLKKDLELYNEICL